MRFRTVIGNGRFSLGPFYMSDVKKVARIVEENPLALEDGWGDPRKYFYSLAKDPKAMLITGRDNKKVGGFISFNFIVPGREANLCGYANRGFSEGVVECGRLALRWAFEKWELRRATAMHSVKNRAATLAALRIGFKREGTMRDAMVFDNEFHDVVVLGIVREEVI
jgi:RimJ/RimL family protein N-acetyltransferase